MRTKPNRRIFTRLKRDNSQENLSCGPSTVKFRMRYFKVALLLFCCGNLAETSNGGREFEPIDWIKADIVTSLPTEAAVPLRCPCDASPNACEQGCCCDRDCEGSLGECEKERALEKWLCDGAHKAGGAKPPIVCVMGGTSAYLGSTYPRQEFLSRTEMKKLLGSALTFNYGAERKLYEPGDPVQNFRRRELMDFLIPLAFNGNCVTGTLAFNISSVSECDIVVTEKNCLRLASQIGNWTDLSEHQVIGDPLNWYLIQPRYEIACSGNCHVNWNDAEFERNLTFGNWENSSRSFHEDRHGTDLRMTYYDQATQMCVNFPVNVTYQVKILGSIITSVRIILNVTNVSADSRVLRYVVVSFGPAPDTETELQNNSQQFEYNSSICALNKPFCWHKTWMMRSLSTEEWLQISQITLLAVVLGIYYIKSAS